jgi:hypothetical protein
MRVIVLDFRIAIFHQGDRYCRGLGRYLKGASGEDECLGNLVQFEFLGFEDYCGGGIAFNLLGIYQLSATNGMF